MHAQVPHEGALVARPVLAMRAKEGLLSSMHEQVLFEVVPLLRAVIALITRKGLLSSVHSHVLNNGAPVAGAKIATVARVWLLSRVRPHVGHKPTLILRSVHAMLAHKRPLLAVHSYAVPCQRILPAAAKVAVLARKRLLPRVHPHVRHHQVVLHRLELALVAFLGLVVGANVLG